MLNGIKGTFALIGSIIGVVALIYFIWALFVPMAIGSKYVERKVIEQAPQYVTSQRRALVVLQTKYTSAEEQPIKTAIQTEMCGIASNLNRDDIPENVNSYVKGCAR